MNKTIVSNIGLTALALVTCAGVAPAQTPARPEVVYKFTGSMPTGVTVSQTGRIFVNYPRWGDPVPYSVAEIKDGREVPYPNVAINRLRRDKPGECLVCVQSVVVDPKDRLWILDPAAPLLKTTLPGGPKMVCVDLQTNKVIQTIKFDPSVVTPQTYLNDVRFDLRKGTAGVAYITDSGEKSRNGIIVVDLATGKARRRLANHPSVKAEPKFLPIVEAHPLMKRLKGQPAQYMKMASDGIAISADGAYIYYTPLASRHLYRVSTDALADDTKTDSEVAATVEDLGTRPSGSDGLESDAKGNLYLTMYEQKAVYLRTPDGAYHPLTRDERMIWPDTLSVAANGYVYITGNQLNRQKDYHQGHDLRQKPYYLFRVKAAGSPVSLK